MEWLISIQIFNRASRVYEQQPGDIVSLFSRVELIQPGYSVDKMNGRIVGQIDGLPVISSPLCSEQAPVETKAFG